MCLNTRKACHYVIAEPNGRYSLGKCKYCGRVDNFVNSYDESMVVDSSVIHTAKRARYSGKNKLD